MLKELVTANELRDLMLTAIRKCGYALPDRSIYIHESSEPNSNWDYGTNTKIQDTCKLELNKIIGELRLRYNLKK